MKNGNYTINNAKTGSKLVVLLHPSDNDEVSIVQYDSNGTRTAQQCRTRVEAEIAIDRAHAAGANVDYEPMRDILGNEVEG